MGAKEEVSAVTAVVQLLREEITSLLCWVINPAPRGTWFALTHIQRAAHHTSQMEKYLIRGSLPSILWRGELRLLACVYQGVGKYTEFNLFFFNNLSQFSQNHRMDEVGKDF